jgi:hypothetical protein
MHILIAIVALILVGLFWRQVAGVLAFLVLVGLALAALNSVARQPAFEATPTAELAAIGLAPWANDTDAEVCTPTRNRALKADDRTLRGWAERHPCPAAGDPNSASSQAVAKAWIDTLAQEVSICQRLKAPGDAGALALLDYYTRSTTPNCDRVAKVEAQVAAERTAEAKAQPAEADAYAALLQRLKAEAEAQRQLGPAKRL